jgi:hypothetical protein
MATREKTSYFVVEIIVSANYRGVIHSHRRTSIHPLTPIVHTQSHWFHLPSFNLQFVNAPYASRISDITSTKTESGQCFRSSRPDLLPKLSIYQLMNGFTVERSDCRLYFRRGFSRVFCIGLEELTACAAVSQGPVPKLRWGQCSVLVYLDRLLRCCCHGREIHVCRTQCPLSAAAKGEARRKGRVPSSRSSDLGMKPR